ncbi:MAG: flavodoxin-dependent (E)-4-hydroxy-3-methylbut-2-enyl-diphosphate synthase [Lentisphaerota bacterium]
MPERRTTRQIKLDKLTIGGGAPVSIQSMTNTDTGDAAATLSQIQALAAAGCEIIRVAVPDKQAVEALPDIIKNSPIPVIGDIHFDYRLALGAISAGIHGIRLNPGNIGDAAKVRVVAEKAGEAGIPIRTGANSGSLKTGFIEEKLRKGLSREEALCEALVDSALEQCAILEQYGFRQIKVSLKASDVPVTVAAYRHFSAISDYPLHIGVTEAGTPGRGIVKSSVGIGTLLLEGIGDTLRVSLTANPLEEIITAVRILESCGLRTAEPDIISCPTCGRTEIDLIKLAEKVERLVSDIKNSGKKIKLKKLAVMGCAVNGPGEARDADLGIAGGRKQIVLFKHGKIIGKFSEAAGFDRFKEELIRSAE